MGDSVLTERLDTGAARACRMEPAAAAPSHSESDAALALVLSSLDDDKAEDVVAVDLRGKSSMADHMVIASGRSARQVTTMADKLLERFKQRFGRSAKVEGKEAGDWALIDCGDVIVHVFRPEVRAFYQIEKMWLEPADIRARAVASA
jgi:ribosome-associated protein